MDSQGRTLGTGWAFRLACLLVILLATGLRLSALGARSLWFDEIAQVTTASEFGATDIIRLHLDQATAPLDHLITDAVVWLGRSEYLLRFPAACFSVLTVALCFALGRTMFGPLEGLIAAFLLAISAFHIHYAQEVRTYALLAFLGSLSLCLLWKALRGDRTRDWLAWTTIGWLGLTAHAFAALWALAQGIYGLTATGWNRWQRDDAFRLQSVRLRKLLLGVVGVLVGAGAQACLAASNYSERGSRAAVQASQAASAVYANLIRPAGHLFVQLGNGIAGGVLCVAAILGTYLTCRRRDWRAIWLLTLSCIVPAALGLIAARASFVARYVIFILPPWLLLVARGLSGVAQAIAARLRYSRVTPLGTASLPLVLFVAVFAVAGVAPVQRYYAQDPTDWRSKADWRSVGRYLSERVLPGDVVIVDSVTPTNRIGDSWPLRCLPHYFPPTQLGAVLLPVTGIGTSELLNWEQGGAWAIAFHPDGPLHADVPDVAVVRFHKLTLLFPRATSTLSEQMLSVLRALSRLQQTPVGEFEVRLALARVYAVDGQFSAAKAELQAARSLALSSAGNSRALRSTAEYLRAQEQHQQQ